MKKILILAVAALLGLVSCSKEHQLIGTWELTTVVTEGVTIDAKAVEMDVTITFKAGGAATVTSDGYSEVVTYAVSGDTLTLDGQIFTISIKGKTLTATTTEDGVAVQMIFTKK